LRSRVIKISICLLKMVFQLARIKIMDAKVVGNALKTI